MKNIILLFLLAFGFAAKAQQAEITYSTLIGGNGNDQVLGTVTVGSSIFVVGTTFSSNFPVTNGSVYGGSQDAFIAKFNADGNMVFATYLGGSGTEEFPVISAEGGSIYVAGRTSSTNFPVTNSSTLGGGTDAFVVKLDTSGNIIFSTYLGGSVNEGLQLTIAGSGSNTFVYGSTNSTNFPVTNSSTLGGGNDAFLTKLDASGNISFATYLGGSGSEGTLVMQLTNNAVYASGRTPSTNFPVTNGSVYAGGSQDNFITKFDLNGNILYSTLLGGNALDGNIGLYAANNKVYIYGQTASTDYPTTDGTFYNGGSQDVYITSLDSVGNIAFSTLLGGAGFETIYDLTVVGSDILINGITISADFPTTDGSSYSGGTGNDPYVARYNSSGTLVLSSVFGGTNVDAGQDAIMDTEGFLVAGNTQSADYPVTNGSLNGSTTTRDVYVTKVDAAGNIVFSTYIGGSAGTEQGINLSKMGSKIYLFGQTPAANYPVTNGSTYAGSTNDLFFTIFDLCPSGYDVTNDTLSSASQSVCSNGFVEQIVGKNIVIPSDSLPSLYRSGIAEDQIEIEANYQWQQSNSATGPWLDIFGAIEKNFTPEPTTTTKYFRRIAKMGPACGGTVISTSNVHTVSVNSFSAPTVDGGGIFNTCSGTSVSLGGSPVATGGTTPYTYHWDNIASSDSTLANPTVSPVSNTVYTVTVTDGNACKQISQAIVNVYKANAGPDVSSCAGDSAKLLAVPVAGINGVTYTWSPAFGLSNTNIIQPMALSAVDTFYELTMVLPVTGGGTCSTKDTVLYRVVPAPDSTNFAGLDQTICFGSIATLGTPEQFITLTIDTVFQSSINGGTGTVANLSDNNFATGARTSTATGQWVVADLGSVQTFNRIKIAGLSVSHSLQTSVDNITYTTQIASISGANNTSLTTINMPNGNVDARYIRIFRSSTGGVNMSELRVENLLYNYTWTPGNNLLSNNTGTTTYVPGITFSPNPNPATYTLTAARNGCIFTDQVVVSTITADADKDGCGPRIIGVESNDVPTLNETFQWRRISGTGTMLGDSNTATVVVSASPTGSPTTYELTTTLNGVSCVDTVVVQDCGCGVDIIVDAPSGCPSFGLGSVSLSAVPVIGASSDYTYSWTPTVGLSSYTDSVVTLTDGTPRTYTVTIKSKLDTSFSCTDNITVNQAAMTLPTFVAKDSTVCGGQVLDIGNTSVAGYTYSWSPAAGLSSASSSNPTLTASETKDYVVTVTDDATGCFIIDTASITVQNTKVDAGGDWVICAASTLTFGTPAEPHHIYAWSPGTANFQNSTDSTDAMPDVLVAITSSYFLKVTDTITGCMAFDTVNVVINSSPTISVPNLTLCFGETDTLGIPKQNGVTYSWSPTIDLDDATKAQPIVTATATRTYTVTATYTGGAGCNATDNPIVTVNDPTFSLTNLTYCPSSGAVALGASAPSGMGSYAWSPVSQVSNSTIANPNTLNPPPSTATTYTLTVVDANGCSASDDITITPTVDAPEAGSSKIICLNEEATIGSASNPTGAGISYSWSPSTGLSSSTSPNPIFTPTSTGAFTFTLTKTESGCSSTDKVTITVVNYSLEPMSAPTICQNSSVEIGVNYQSGARYFWSPGITLSDSTFHRPLATPVATTVYTLRSLGVNGCLATGQVAVGVSPKPAPLVSMNSTTICLGGTVQFNPIITPAVGPYNYLWSPNDGSVSNVNVLNPTILSGNVGDKSYTLYVTDSIGCVGSAIATLTSEFCPLPIELLDFTTACRTNKVLLTWQTASEQNSSHFEIERTTNGQDWIKIGQVAAKGYSYQMITYTFTDNKPSTNINYYRLKMVDFDGSIEYSNIIHSICNSSLTNSKISIYPNPMESELTIVSESELGEVEIWSIEGKLIYQTTSIESNLKINTSEYTPGVYIVKIGNEVFKVIK